MSDVIKLDLYILRDLQLMMHYHIFIHISYDLEEIVFPFLFLEVGVDQASGSKFCGIERP